MMVGVAVLAILSWLVIGLGQHGRRFFGVPPLYMVVAFPFLLTLATTFAVTLLELRREGAQKEQSGPVDQSQSTAGGPSGHDTPAGASKLTISVLNAFAQSWEGEPPCEPRQDRARSEPRNSADYGDTESASSVRSGNDPVSAGVNRVRLTR